MKSFETPEAVKKVVSLFQEATVATNARGDPHFAISKYIYIVIPVAISNSMGPGKNESLDVGDFNGLDRAILDYLTEGCGEGVPWGIATPAVVRTALLEREYPDVPVRQIIKNRMQKLADAGHLENRYDKGVYAFLSDPRNSD